jgi:hypothetical protein
MDISIEKVGGDCSLGSLFQQIINDMKVSSINPSPKHNLITFWHKSVYVNSFDLRKVRGQRTVKLPFHFRSANINLVC